MQVLLHSLCSPLCFRAGGASPAEDAAAVTVGRAQTQTLGASRARASAGGAVAGSTSAGCRGGATGLVGDNSVTPARAVAPGGEGSSFFVQCVTPRGVLRGSVCLQLLL